MRTETFDIAIVGGGLAGGLIALALCGKAPHLSLALFEAGRSFGGNHRWSWFEGDLEPAGKDLMAEFSTTSWSGGNEVRFPAYSRQLQSNYRSLASADFDAALRKKLPQEAVRPSSRVSELGGHRIVLDDGREMSVRIVIDCRDAVPSCNLTGGWQVFLGQHLRTDAPHGLGRPIIMDATVSQHDAYRFVYVLPLSPDEMFVEDTYYADSPVLDAPTLRDRIARYTRSRGWQGAVLHEETGVLPVITGGNFPAYRASLGNPGVVHAGARGGFVHPLTSYTVPIAVECALAIADKAKHDLGGLSQFVDYLAAEHWRRTGFYRLLGKMLFDAAEPEERYRVFERFYRLPESLIERFYAARSTPLDKFRILTGKPPVPVFRAARALLGKGAPLVQGPQP